MWENKMYETEIFLLSVTLVLVYYGTLMVLFHHYFNKYRKEDEAKGIYPSPMLGAQVEDWHIIMLIFAFAPLVITFIFILLCK
jgi:hypothetical protein